MRKNTWRIYWSSIVLSLAPIQLYHLYNYIRQPDLTDLYAGKGLLFGSAAVGAALLIFFGANLYSLSQCMKHQDIPRWIKAFCASILLVYILSSILNELAVQFMALHVWQQSQHA